jgi:hypothetical protein
MAHENRHTGIMLGETDVRAKLEIGLPHSRSRRDYMQLNTRQKVFLLGWVPDGKDFKPISSQRNIPHSEAVCPQ